MLKSFYRLPEECATGTRKSLTNIDKVTLIVLLEKAMHAVLASKIRGIPNGTKKKETTEAKLQDLRVKLCSQDREPKGVLEHVNLLAGGVPRAAFR
jgi:hypothetical protein